MKKSFINSFFVKYCKSDILDEYSASFNLLIVKKVKNSEKNDLLGIIFIADFLVKRNLIYVSFIILLRFL